jgi:hypothetical protein
MINAIAEISRTRARTLPCRRHMTRPPHLIVTVRFLLAGEALNVVRGLAG